MIYNDEFVWLHFPKCAGTKIEQLFERYLSSQETITQDIVDPRLDPSIAWHDSIADRTARDPAFELGDRTVVCSFRRLSSWLESRYNFEFQRSRHLTHQPEMLLEGKFLEQSGRESHADHYARKYLPEKLLRRGQLRFLRTEFFEEDFKSIFGVYVDVSAIPEWEYRKNANASKSFVPPHIRTRIIEDAESIYAHCPYWRRVEEVAYLI